MSIHQQNTQLPVSSYVESLKSEPDNLPTRISVFNRVNETYK